MGHADTAKTLTLVGAILSMVLGIIYLVWGIVQIATFPSWLKFLGVSWLIYGIISLIFGFLTLFLARKELLQGDLKTGAIMCFIFGGITSAAIGGILTVVAGILAIIAWNEQRSVAEAPPPPPPPPA